MFFLACFFFFSVFLFSHVHTHLCVFSNFHNTMCAQVCYMLRFLPPFAYFSSCSPFFYASVQYMHEVNHVTRTQICCALNITHTNTHTITHTLKYTHHLSYMQTHTPSLIHTNTHTRTHSFVSWRSGFLQQPCLS